MQKTFFYCALPCEAKPLIDIYKLKNDTAVQAFSIFRNDDIVLTVTGIGKVAMAAGVAYTQALHSQNSNSVLVNIGIAGHKHHAIGSLFLADKITDNDSGKRYYPPMVSTPPCPTANLITFAKPQQAYPETSLCDMEASSFYETATRFTTGELCQSIKIISDNAECSTERIKPQLVSDLIANKMDVINNLLAALTQLASGLPVAYDTGLYEHIVNRFRFSVSEQAQLKKLLTHCRGLNSENKINLTATSANNGKEFLGLLNQTLNSAEFTL